MPENPIQSLNDIFDVGQDLEEFEARLAMELLEERLELACWQCTLCPVECNVQCRIP